ncbi:hypothetical protein [Francisella sp. SYW-9]|uniref:hypothetical protein n=1 Tax=Francisella sp. SYW-9 TaxID=2610888 RepID=UPI00123D76CA|nr:hypothetical protein [Francisella sp. SYW-9]
MIPHNGLLSDDEINNHSDNNKLITLNDRDLEGISNYPTEIDKMKFDGWITCPKILRSYLYFGSYFERVDFEHIFPQGNYIYMSDIHQKYLGECFIDSSLISIINKNPFHLLLNMRYKDNRIYVKFHTKKYINDIFNTDYDTVIYSLEPTILKGNMKISGYNFNNHALWANLFIKAYAAHCRETFKQEGISLLF